MHTNPTLYTWILGLVSLLEYPRRRQRTETQEGSTVMTFSPFFEFLAGLCVGVLLVFAIFRKR